MVAKSGKIDSASQLTEEKNLSSSHPKDRLSSSFHTILPYLLLLFCSLLPFTTYFLAGISQGDDLQWHLSYMYDLYYGFKQGFFLPTTSHIISGNYAENIYLFYGPFPHYLVVLLTLAFEWTGIDLITMMKIVTIASVFISGVFVYWLAKRITASSRIGVFFGMMFIFFPYRIYDFLRRAAFSEAFAIGLIPIVFYAVYRILHDEKARVAPYLLLVFSMSALIMSHPFTCLITAIAVILVILANIVPLYHRLKDWHVWLYLVSSVILIFSFVSVYFFPMLQAIKENLYVISDVNLMGTRLANMQWSVVRLNEGYTGLLSWHWLMEMSPAMNWSNGVDSGINWSLSLCFFVFSCLGTILTDYFLQKSPKLAPWRTLICFFTTFFLNTLYLSRAEIYLALALFYVSYLYIEYDHWDEEELLPRRNSAIQLVTNPEIYVVGILVIISGVMAFSAGIWEAVPSIFYNAQFTFRMIAIFGFLLLYFFIPFFKPLAGKKIPLQGLAFTTCLIFALCLGPVDKRMALENAGNTYYYHANDFMSSNTTVGFNNEYVPTCIRDSNYVPTYPSGLYYTVRAEILDDEPFTTGLDNYLTPVFVEGQGQAQVTALNSPHVEMSVSVTSETSLLQIPQFYYDGYEISYFSTALSGKANGTNADGLLAFQLPKGEYSVSVDYVGTKTQQVGLVFFYLSFPASLTLGILGVYFKKKEKPTAKEE